MITWYWALVIAIAVCLVGFYVAWAFIFGKLLKSFFEGWKR